MLDLLFHRRYVILFSFTGAILLSLYLSPKIILESTKSVETVQVSSSDIKTTVTGSGSIVSENQREVYYSSELKVSAVNVKIGDTVTAGQDLIDINREDTIEKIENDNGVTNNTAVDAGAYSAFADSYSGYINSYLSSYLNSIISASSGISSEYNSTIPSSITAPISGVVTAINAQAGSFTSTSESIVEITDLSALEVKAKINEISIANVKEGQSVTITGDGFADSYTGKVEKIYPTAETVTTTSGTLAVVTTVISIDDPGSDIKPGLTANAEIVTSEETSVSVPYEAVQEDSSNNEYVYVVKKSKAYKTIVKTGTEYNDSVEILSGIEPGDYVVLNPSSDLENGQYVRQTVTTVSEESEND